LKNHLHIYVFLYAFAAFDISQQVWNTELNSARDALPAPPGHFQFPTAANSKVYAPTSTQQLVAYGMLVQQEVALNFTTQPWWTGALATSSVPVGAFLPAFTVSVMDATGHVVSSSWSVTITMSGAVKQVTGPSTVECVSGVATFTGLSIPISGVVTLIATTPTLSPSMSFPVLVTPITPFPSANLPIPSQNTPPSGPQGAILTNPVAAAPQAAAVDPVALGLGIGLTAFVCCLVAVFAAFVFYRERHRYGDDSSTTVQNVDLGRPIPTMPLNQIYGSKMEIVYENL